MAVFKRYSIRSWCHYSNFIPSLHRGYPGLGFYSTMGTFYFDGSCRYEVDESCCVNKLFGFSFGLFGVHKNSVRFGWTYDKSEDKIAIWSYVYADGKLHKKKICTVDISEFVQFEIMVDKFGAYFTVDNDLKYIFRHTFDSSLFDRYLLDLGPYFGGKSRAPHEIVIFNKK